MMSLIGAIFASLGVKQLEFDMGPALLLYSTLLLMACRLIPT
jgi:hypothetical protein